MAWRHALFWVCFPGSGNELGPEAGNALAEALTTNSTIQNIEYVSAFCLQTDPRFLVYTEEGGPISLFFHLLNPLAPCVVLCLCSSLGSNQLGPEAGKALAEALKTNTTIQSIKYVSAACL